MTPSLGTVSAAVDALRRGGTIILPTETVYGLGAHALNVRAVARIFEIKRRPRFNPLIVHGWNFAMLCPLIAHLPDEARALGERYWPGPLTLVLPKTDRVPDLVTAGHPSVAIRIPSHPIALALLEAFGEPVAAPSANLFGQLSPTSFEDLDPEVLRSVEVCLEGGPCDVGLESTIISFLGPPTLLRAGAISLEALTDFLGPIRNHTAPTDRPIAPGQLLSHYAPRTPLRLATPSSPLPSGIRVGLVALRAESVDVGEYTVIERLSPTGDLREAAQNLFSSLKRLDGASLDLIVAHPVPREGLGAAINDRLHRAASGQWL
jgi:L-threonylcarbamoyladenylate synthase